MQGQVHILDNTGHTTLVWDTETSNRAPENGPLDQAYVEAEFDRLVNQLGYKAIGESATGEKELLRSFRNEEFPEIVISPQLVGG